MDRGRHRAQKSRIRARLRQTLEQKLLDNQEWTHNHNAHAVTQAEIDKLRRHVFRNEGKHYSLRFTYTTKRCGCNICADNRRYRTLWEAERMRMELREWRHGEGGY